MTCDQPKIQLYLYLDGELALSDAAEVEQHLQHCQLCQDEVAGHYRLQALLQEALQMHRILTVLFILPMHRNMICSRVIL